MRNDSLHYLKNVGVDFKTAESPDLWTFLEDHISHPDRIGHRFVPMSPTIMADLILHGENAILDAMVMRHLNHGTIGEVTQTIEMPFIVGSNDVVALTDVNYEGLFKLIEHPGTTQEHLIQLVVAREDMIPSTHRVTVRGGVYADGHTAGYYDLYPGVRDENTLKAQDHAWLALPHEIMAMAHAMEQNLDHIVIAPRAACEAMIMKVSKKLGS